MAAAIILSLLRGVLYTASPDDFPTVDLGYARHAPTFVNTSIHNVSYATYRNIRFAQPPLGDLRFRAPVTPPPIADGIQDGIVPRNSTNCLQTWPHHLITPPGRNGSTWGSEDCLFLDVIVPDGLEPGSKVPVVHWLYGGGLYSGAKEWSGNPAAMFDDVNGKDKFIAVASNYRLGPWGWMSSDTEPSITPNIGLLDAWAALEWTQQYVHLFGGDPDRVTAMGQSAGSGILQHFLAIDADNQGKVVPFHQAILSSPGYRPHNNRSKEMTKMYNIFLNATDCDDVACLRSLSKEKMIKGDRYMMLKAHSGTFDGPSIGFGPIIDGNLVHDVPENTLDENKNAGPNWSGRIKRVIAGSMEHEFTGREHTSWKKFTEIFARTPSKHTIETLEDLYGPFDLHSPSPSRSHREKEKSLPFDAFYSDINFKCHAYFSAKFWSNESRSTSYETASYRYSMSIPPAKHGGDLPYYFYDQHIGRTSKTKLYPNVAREMQHYFRRFILGQTMDDWPEYAAQGSDKPSWMDITKKGFKKKTAGDEVALEKRCKTIVELLEREKDGW